MPMLGRAGFNICVAGRAEICVAFRLDGAAGFSIICVAGRAEICVAFRLDGAVGFSIMFGGSGGDMRSVSAWRRSSKDRGMWMRRLDYRLECIGGRWYRICGDGRLFRWWSANVKEDGGVRSRRVRMTRLCTGSCRRRRRAARCYFAGRQGGIS